MPHSIINYKGQTKEVDCIACAIQSKQIENPGLIAETEFFSAEQDCEYPIPGFLVIVSKRHLQSIDEFSEAEQQDFIKFICRVRASMRQALAIEHVYLHQEEDTTTSHFHVWIFPRYAWMKEEFGRKIESVRPIMKYAKENFTSKDNLNEVETAIEKLKKAY